MSLAKFVGVVLAQVLIPLLEYYRGKITSDELLKRIESAIQAIEKGDSESFENSLGSSKAGKYSGRGKLRNIETDRGDNVDGKQSK